MADDETTTNTRQPKTERLGTIDAVKAKKIAGFEAYLKAAADLSQAREAAMAAKNKVRDSLKKTLKEQRDLQFVVGATGEVTVFVNLVAKKQRIVKNATDLSDLIK